VELQVRKEADGAGDYVGDWGGSLRARESGDAGPDGGFLGKGVSGNVGKKGRVRNSPAFHITYGIVICYIVIIRLFLEKLQICLLSPDRYLSPQNAIHHPAS
jgi:hypothetical protein